MRDKLRDGILNLSLLVLTIILFTIAFEVSLRYFYPSSTSLASHINKGMFITHIEGITWGLKPNYMGSHKRSEFDTSVRINSKGLRDDEHEYNKPDNVYRIVGLGDSLTFGYGVEENETYLSVLETKLNKLNSEVDFETLNTGVPSWFTANELAYLKVEGVNYNPDLVVLGFFMDDVCGNVGGEYSSLTVQDGYPILAESIYSKNKENVLTRAVTFIKLHSRTYFFVVDKIWKIKNGPLNFNQLTKNNGKMNCLNFVESYVNLLLTNYTMELTESWNVTEGMLNDLNTFAAEHDAKTLIVYIPPLWQVDERRWNETILQYNVDVEEYNPGKLDELLFDFGNRNNISVLTLTQDFRKRVGDGEQLYHERDGHLNVNGHVRAAEMIYDKLVKDELIPG